MVIAVLQPDGYKNNEFYVVLSTRLENQTELNIPLTRSFLTSAVMGQYEYYVVVDDENATILKMMIK